MATHNDITGDALVSRPLSRAYMDNFDRVQAVDVVEKVFEVYYCDACNIKVSTSNGKCPCCGKDLAK